MAAAAVAAAGSQLQRQQQQPCSRGSRAHACRAVFATRHAATRLALAATTVLVTLNRPACTPGVAFGSGAAAVARQVHAKLPAFGCSRACRISSSSSSSCRRFRHVVHAESGADSISWLPVQKIGWEEPTAIPTTSDIRDLPVLLVDDVYVPGSEVLLNVRSPEDCQLYEGLLLEGRRLVATFFHGPGPGQVAEYGTLLFLEDLRVVSLAVEGDVKYVAEHTAVGRVRWMGLVRHKTSEGGDLVLARTKVYIENGDDSPMLAQETLAPELEELTALQQRAGVAAGEATATELNTSLFARPLDPRLQPLQGLWRAASGVRVRVDGDVAVGLGRMHAVEDEFSMRLGRGGEFRARCQEKTQNSAAAEVLHWSDGDTWTRIAAQPPYQFDAFGAAGFLWRAVRRWRELGDWRAEVRRGEARWRSADSIVQRLRDASQADSERMQEDAVEEWQRAASGADTDAADMRMEEVLLPCQRLLQASSMQDRLRIFGKVLAVEATKLRLRLALRPAECNIKPATADHQAQTANTA